MWELRKSSASSRNLRCCRTADAVTEECGGGPRLTYIQTAGWAFWVIRDLSCGHFPRCLAGTPAVSTWVRCRCPAGRVRPYRRRIAPKISASIPMRSRSSRLGRFSTLIARATFTTLARLRKAATRAGRRKLDICSLQGWGPGLSPPLQKVGYDRAGCSRNGIEVPAMHAVHVLLATEPSLGEGVFLLAPRHN